MPATRISVPCIYLLEVVTSSNLHPTFESTLIFDMDDAISASVALENETVPQFKRRKVYRKRPVPGNDDAIEASTRSRSDPLLGQTTVPDELINGIDSDAEDLGLALPTSQLSVSSLLRARKSLQRRRGGIEFSKAIPTPTTNIETALMPSNHPLEDEAPPIQITDRFAPQTGQVANVDKHMYEPPSFQDFHQPSPRRTY